MDLLPQFVKEHQPLIGALIAGLFAIIAAIIRRPPRQAKPGGGRPVARLLGPPLLSLLLGAGLLAAENFAFNLDPDGDLLSLQNPGALLCLGGCVFLSAGVIWGVIDLFRLLTWPRPKDLPAPAASSSLIGTAYSGNPPPRNSGTVRKRER